MEKYSEYLWYLKTNDWSVPCISGSTPELLFQGLPETISWPKAEIWQTDIAEQVKDSIKNLANLDTFYSIHFSVGATQCVFQTMASLCSRDDRIILDLPYYEPYYKVAQLLGLKIETYPRSNDFEEEFDSLQKRIAQHSVKMILISNPNFFTGHIYSAQKINKLAELGPLLVVDEVMLPLHDKAALTHTSPQSLRNVVSISGLSKPAGLSSLRVGWCISSPQLIEKIEKFSLLLNVDMPTLSLQAASLAFSNWENLFTENWKRIEQNRQFLLSRAPQLLDYFVRPFSNGQINALKIPKDSSSAKDFTLKALHSGVNLIPSQWFGREDLVRIALLTEPNIFAEGIQKLVNFYQHDKS